MLGSISEASGQLLLLLSAVFATRTTPSGVELYGETR
jgi:hypothetical protein